MRERVSEREGGMIEREIVREGGIEEWYDSVPSTLPPLPLSYQPRWEVMYRTRTF